MVQQWLIEVKCSNKMLSQLSRILLFSKSCFWGRPTKRPLLWLAFGILTPPSFPSKHSHLGHTNTLSFPRLPVSFSLSYFLVSSRIPLAQNFLSYRMSNKILQITMHTQYEKTCFVIFEFSYFHIECFEMLNDCFGAMGFGASKFLVHGNVNVKYCFNIWKIALFWAGILVLFCISFYFFTFFPGRFETAHTRTQLYTYREFAVRADLGTCF